MSEQPRPDSTGGADPARPGSSAYESPQWSDPTAPVPAPSSPPAGPPPPPVQGSPLTEPLPSAPQGPAPEVPAAGQGAWVPPAEQPAPPPVQPAGPPPAQPFGAPAPQQPTSGYGQLPPGGPVPGYGAGPQPGMPYPQGGGYAPPLVPRKDPAISLLVSFFVPGVGSMMNGDTNTGVGILVGYILGFVITVCGSFVIIGPFIGFPVSIGFWAWGMVDAYQGATRFNQRNGYPA